MQKSSIRDVILQFVKQLFEFDGSTFALIVSVSGSCWSRHYHSAPGFAEKGGGNNGPSFISRGAIRRLGLLTRCGEYRADICMNEASSL